MTSTRKVNQLHTVLSLSGSPEALLTDPGRLAAAYISETALTANQAGKHPRNDVSQSQTWQGTIAWRWGQFAYTQGTFTGSLLRAATSPPGSRWCSPGDDAVLSSPVYSRQNSVSDCGCVRGCIGAVCTASLPSSARSARLIKLLA